MPHKRATPYPDSWFIIWVSSVLFHPENEYCLVIVFGFVQRLSFEKGLTVAQQGGIEHFFSYSTQVFEVEEDLGGRQSDSIQRCGSGRQSEGNRRPGGALCSRGRRECERCIVIWKGFYVQFWRALFCWKSVVARLGEIGEDEFSSFRGE